MGDRKEDSVGHLVAGDDPPKCPLVRVLGEHVAELDARCVRLGLVEGSELVAPNVPGATMCGARIRQASSVP
jgi:hypothetical protein